MNDIHLVGPADMARPRPGLATLRSVIATWSERIRIRWQLRQVSRDNHLIDDIGLTRRQIEAEVAKTFWQA